MKVPHCNECEHVNVQKLRKVTFRDCTKVSPIRGINYHESRTSSKWCPLREVRKE